MKKFAGAILLVCACAGLALARPQAAPAAAAKAPSVSDAVKQLERDWLDAAKAGDADKLNAIIADDWMGIESDGTTVNKKTYVEWTRSGAAKLESSEIGPMTVKVMGSVAVCQGSDTEKSSMKGKDTSGKYVWMDVFAKRDDKWVAVRSQTAMLK
jgi:ketosteroid isomerase-like protein